MYPCKYQKCLGETETKDTYCSTECEKDELIEQLTREAEDLGFEAATAKATLKDADNKIKELNERSKNDSDLFCQIMVEAIKGIADAVIVRYATYDGRHALAMVKTLRIKCDKLQKSVKRSKDKWRRYEQDYILPVFKWAEEMGIDLRALVSEGKGNSTVRFFQTLREKINSLRTTPKVMDVLKDTLEALEYVGCQFFACPGPNEPSVAMATCCVCEAIRKGREIIPVEED
jgi:hypothetical protein